MKKVLCLISLLAISAAAVRAADFQDLGNLSAAGLITAPEAAIASPVPAAPVIEEVPQDLVNRFNSAADQLRMFADSLTWVANDMDNLERRARQIAQYNMQDSFFQFDLRRMSSDMARRFEDLRRLSFEVRDLRALAQKSKELNDAARRIDRSARDIMRYTWPNLENASQRLEWSVRSCRPELVGYDAQWNAMDISRYSRQLSDQARYTSNDAQNLVTATQP